jgi:hypothetical protein
VWYINRRLSIALGTTIFRSRRSAERCFTHYCATAVGVGRSTASLGFHLSRRRRILAGVSEGISCKAGMLP